MFLTKHLDDELEFWNQMLQASREIGTAEDVRTCRFKTINLYVRITEARVHEQEVVDILAESAQHLLGDRLPPGLDPSLVMGGLFMLAQASRPSPIMAELSVRLITRARALSRTISSIADVLPSAEAHDTYPEPGEE